MACTIEDDGFTDFLREIVDSEALEEAALGIARLVIDQGQEGLSEKQAYVFKAQIRDEFITDGCQMCGNDIPWCEMMEAYDNGGYCGWCAHMMAKDD